jgi:hypothetical protein
MKNLLIYLSIFVCFIGIIGIFWYQEWQYSLPTPKPKNYQSVPLGKKITWQELPNNGKPIHLHFYNPLCPCSQFNLEHLQSLIQKYQEKINFVAVLQVEEHEKGIDFFRKQKLSIPFIIDIGGKLADSCGVYSTPQAVILDKNKQIYFKGNYNLSRYCTNKETEFARIALENIIQNKKLPQFLNISIESYGCTLPSEEIE